MIQKLHHLSTRRIFEARVFETITSFSQLTPRITEYGLTAGERGSQEYNDRCGEAMEVFAEFFLVRFGSDKNPRLGITKIDHTSQDKHNEGYDFTFKSLPCSEHPQGELGHLQVKFRSNPTYKFKFHDLMSFIAKAGMADVPPERRVLFTNLEHNKSETGVFHYSFAADGAADQMRVVDSSFQEEHIDRTPLFWDEFVESIAFSAEKPDNNLPLFEFYPHQARVHTACMNCIAPNNKIVDARGISIVATGGGKTYNEFRVIRETLLECGGSLSVMVGPTIDLLRQHHEYFEQFDFFHKDNVAVVHFRTGSEAKSDTYIDYSQTTSPEAYDRIMANNVGKKVLIFVTYASEENLFNIIRERGETVDLCVWDEFHHTVKQKREYKNHLLSLPVTANLFFSASHKNGRIVSSLNEEIYGSILIDVTFKELREAGILVPQLIIRPIRVNPENRRMASITRELRKAAERDNFDLQTATIEAAASMLAREDLLNSYGRSNIITFSKKVAMCKAITESDTIQRMMPDCLIKSVYAAVPAKQRTDIYNKIKKSDDSILHQYSVVKEGIDVTAFNASITSRVMDAIGTQQGTIGRIARADPRDTAALKAGDISIDSPIGWHKYTATVYIIMHDTDTTDMETFREFMMDLISKLQFSGLDIDDYQFSEVLEERTGISPSPNGDVPIINTDELFPTDTLENFAANLHIERSEPPEEERIRAAFEYSLNHVNRRSYSLS